MKTISRDRRSCTFASVARSSGGFSTIELIVTVGMGLVLTAMTVPMLYRVAQSYKVSGTARGLAAELALAKMRAAAEFTHAQLNVNLSAGSYTVQVWNKSLSPAAFATEGGTQYLPAGAVLGFGNIATAPPGSQTMIGQTSLILFNSRGIPIDGTGAPTSNNALYVTDVLGRYVDAVTVSASGKVSIWRYDLHSISWVKQ
jgi:Tfp pilus assembly protein FimT